MDKGAAITTCTGFVCVGAICVAAILKMPDSQGLGTVLGTGLGVIGGAIAGGGVTYMLARDKKPPEKLPDMEPLAK